MQGQTEVSPYFLLCLYYLSNTCDNSVASSVWLRISSFFLEVPHAFVVHGVASHF